MALRATGKHDIGHRLHQQQKTLSVDRAGKVVAGQPCSRMTAVLSVLQAACWGQTASMTADTIWDAMVENLPLNKSIEEA